MMDPKAVADLRARRVKEMEQSAAEYEPNEWIDQRFASLAVGTGTESHIALKKFLADPDEASLHEIARRGPTAEARKDARARLTAKKITEVCDAFEAAVPEFHPAPANFQLLFRETAHRLLPGKPVADEAEWALIDANLLTVQNLQDSYRTLYAAGRLIVPKGVIRPLTQRELDDVVGVAEVRGAEPAVIQYVCIRSGRGFQTSRTERETSWLNIRNW